MKQVQEALKGIGIPWLFPHGLMDTCMNIPPTLVYTKYKLFCPFCQAPIRKYKGR